MRHLSRQRATAEHSLFYLAVALEQVIRGFAKKWQAPSAEEVWSMHGPAWLSSFRLRVPCARALRTFGELPLKWMQRHAEFTRA